MLHTERCLFIYNSVLKPEKISLSNVPAFGYHSLANIKAVGYAHHIPALHNAKLKFVVSIRSPVIKPPPPGTRPRATV